MKNILSILTQHIEHALYKAYPELISVGHISSDVTQSKSDNFGNYQCNAPLRLSKIINQQPRIIAQEIIKHIELTIDGQKALLKIEIAGPGFINIFLEKKYIAFRITTMLKDAHFGIDYPEEPSTIIVDFSSPNIAKEMHVGHLRSTIIGDSLARTFEFLGHNVLRLNHIGDWGTSFGMLIAYMKEHSKEVLSGSKSTSLSELVSFYKLSKKQFDEDIIFKKQAQEEVVKLQSGDLQALAAWEIICTISRIAYQQIYDILNVTLIERGESFYNQLLPEIIADLESKQVITVSQGARCIFLDGFIGREGESLPLIVQKSDGGYNYDTTDLAALRHRITIEKADRIIYVTDAGQSMHFNMIFSAAEKAGYLDKQKVMVDHVAFGLVLGADGKKFKTRSGETEKLIDLLNAAIDYAQKIVEEKSPDLAKEEKETIARTLGISAVKYADLSTNRTGDYLFSYEKMLKFEGNTAIFLIYTYVRAQSIKRRLGFDFKGLLEKNTIMLEHESEFILGLHLAQFDEILAIVSKDLMPNRLAEYLYQLAEKFNAFFRDCRVEGSVEKESRLLLCELFSKAMQQGLDLLGIKTIERM